MQSDGTVEDEQPERVTAKRAPERHQDPDNGGRYRGEARVPGEPERGTGDGNSGDPEPGTNARSGYGHQARYPREPECGTSDGTTGGPAGYRWSLRPVICR